MWIDIVITAAYILLALPLTAWIVLRRYPRVPPTEPAPQKGVRASLRSLRDVAVPLIQMALIAGLWAGFGWHRQWWWYPLLIGVTVWWLRAQVRDLRRDR
jgi:hypothetical protein